MEEGKYETAARFVFNEKGIRFSRNCGAASGGGGGGEDLYFFLGLAGGV